MRIRRHESVVLARDQVSQEGAALPDTAVAMLLGLDQVERHRLRWVPHEQPAVIELNGRYDHDPIALSDSASSVRPNLRRHKPWVLLTLVAFSSRACRRAFLPTSHTLSLIAAAAISATRT